MYIPPPPSPEAQELSGHLVDVINAYQADHPYMTPQEVQRAVSLAQGAVPGTHKSGIKVALIGLIVIIGLVVLGFLSVAQPS